MHVRPNLQRRDRSPTESPVTLARAPLPEPAQPLTQAASSEPRLRHDFGRIRVHDDSGGAGPPLTSKLPISSPGDTFEREADRVAGAVMAGEAAARSGAPTDRPALRRCGSISSETCPCHDAPPVVGEVLRSPGQPLDRTTRSFMESRFGHDFGGVRVHADARAAESARSVNALAYTVGNSIAFDAGRYAPGTPAGQRLLAHELTHVVQQNKSSVPALARQHAIQQDESSPASGPRATDFRRITMHFDGAELVVRGDNREILRFSAQSGRPIPLSSADAEACGADRRTDTYMNDKRFVGIRNAGPIPEGTYTFRAASVQQFTASEEFRLIMGGVFGPERVPAAGQSVHAGDWGSGRVALNKVGRVQEGPCGNANRRSEFFLHGGVMAGSSGCIDIGGHFDEVASFLRGYRGAVTVTVEYSRPPPSVGYFTGLSGAIAYGAFDVQHGPRLALGVETAAGGARALGSVGYDLIAGWAGGAASLGLRLDVPMNDREAFVRAGLEGGTNVRILGALHGRLFGGVMLPLAGESGGPSGYLGAGVGYDFGRVQLEALYDVLRPASEDERVHQVMLGVGFRFGRE